VSAVEVLKGLGTQLVAAGTGHIFEGIFQSLILNPLGPEMIGIGTAEAAFGASLAGVGGALGGGSRGGGGRNGFSRTAAPASPTPFNVRDGSGGGLAQGSPTINVYSLNPTAETGLAIHRSLKKAQQQGMV
jgi:hypothetical protein